MASKHIFRKPFFTTSLIVQHQILVLYNIDFQLFIFFQKKLLLNVFSYKKNTIFAPAKTMRRSLKIMPI